MIWDRVREYPQQGGLTRSCAAADQQRLAEANLVLQKGGNGTRERAARDQVIDRIVTAGELPDSDAWSLLY